MFPVKEIAMYIILAVQPVKLRRRLEYEVSTTKKKMYTKDFQLLYTLLVSKFEVCFELSPSGFINAGKRTNQNSKSKQEAEKGKAGGDRIKCFKCIK